MKIPRSGGWRVHGRFLIRFREGLDVRAVKMNYSRLDSEAGDFHGLDLFLGSAGAPWDVLASWAEGVSRETRYDVWCGSDPVEWGIRNAIAELARRSEDGIEVLFDDAGGFLKGIRTFGPKLFGVRRGTINKVLQLAGVLPWSRHRIDGDKLLGGSDQSCIDLLGREREFAKVDSQCIVVLSELLVGGSVRLTKKAPPCTDRMDTAFKGMSTWIYWGR